MGSPTNRRKRKRTRRVYAALRNNLARKRGLADGRIRTPSLPGFAICFGLALTSGVYVHKTWTARHKIAGLKGRYSGRDSDLLDAPLALLLQEQHEIDTKAASYAHPTGRCLVDSTSEHFTERLGLFTCVADARFFLRAVAVSRGFTSPLVITVGEPVRAGLPAVNHAHLEGSIRYGEDSLPRTFDLVLIDANKDLSSQAWSTLVLGLLQGIASGGVIAIRGQHKSNAADEAGAAGEEKDREAERSTTASPILAELERAVANLMGASSVRVAAAVGDFDGGVVVLRHALGEAIDRRHGHEGGDFTATSQRAPTDVPPLLYFEDLFTWAMGEDMTATAVQGQFGGASAVRTYALQRAGRATCLKEAERAVSEHLVGDEGRADNANLRRSHYKRHGAPEESDRLCLEQHLQNYPHDVRAAFALAMILRAEGGNRADLRVKRVRDKVLAASGQQGALLWRELHDRAGAMAMVGALQ